MPCIQLTLSQPLTDQNKSNIKARLGKAITAIPGKSEAWLMVVFHDKASIFFKGNQNADSAFVDVEIYGQENARAFNALTADICDILDDELSLPADRIYVKYGTTNHWGWNGGNF